MIKKKKNTKEILKFKHTELVFFSCCNDSEFTVMDKSKKIVIENCKNLVLTINEKVITNYLEIINSENITLHINVPIFTMTIDNSTKLIVNFKDTDCFQMLVWTKVNELELHIGGNKISLEVDSSANLDWEQVITHKNDKGDIVTERARRDSCGRIVSLV